MLKPPSMLKKIFERLGIREIEPKDLAKDREVLDRLYRKYPSLAGDRTAIGPGDDGHCQDWCGNPLWWKNLVGASLGRKKSV